MYTYMSTFIEVLFKTYDSQIVRVDEKAQFI